MPCPCAPLYSVSPRYKGVWVAWRGEAVSCTSSTCISRQPISEPEPTVGIACSLGCPPHCESCLGLGGGECGAFVGGAGRAKDEKGVSTQPAALVYSHPNTMESQARPGALLTSG